MNRSIRRGPLLGLAVLAASAIAMLAAAGSASAYVFTYSIHLDAATQSASGLPGDAGGSGTSNITMNDATNQVCANTTWSGLHSPVVTGHIHGGAYGQPEDPAVTIPIMGVFPNGAPSGTGTCSIVPNAEIDAIYRCPKLFEVVLHSQKHPWGAVRGQFSGGSLTPRPCTNIPPDPGPF